MVKFDKYLLKYLSLRQEYTLDSADVLSECQARNDRKNIIRESV